MEDINAGFDWMCNYWSYNWKLELLSFYIERLRALYMSCWSSQWRGNIATSVDIPLRPHILVHIRSWIEKWWTGRKQLGLRIGRVYRNILRIEVCRLCEDGLPMHHKSYLAPGSIHGICCNWLARVRAANCCCALRANCICFGKSSGGNVRVTHTNSLSLTGPRSWIRYWYCGSRAHKLQLCEFFWISTHCDVRWVDLYSMTELRAKFVYKDFWYVMKID